MVLTGFLLFNNPVPVGGRSPLKRSITYSDSLTLSHAQNIFSLEFSALSFARPARTRYRYRLEKLEMHWNETTAANRLVTYTTLPRGDYRFRVQAKDNRGGWSEPRLTLAIRVLPAWWNTWQVRTVWITFLVVLTWAAYQLRLRQLQHEFNLRVQERVDERTRIARELHDTLLQNFQASLVQIYTARKLFFAPARRGAGKTRPCHRHNGTGHCGGPRHHSRPAQRAAVRKQSPQAADHGGE
jgi:hypothetical protein